MAQGSSCLSSSLINGADWDAGDEGTSIRLCSVPKPELLAICISRTTGVVFLIILTHDAGPPGGSCRAQAVGLDLRGLHQR